LPPKYPFNFVSKRQDGACAWVTVRHISLPDSVDFKDYSAIAYNPKTNLVAITSQEDAKLWVRIHITRYLIATASNA
jgi:hypothetical protein